MDFINAEKHYRQLTSQYQNQSISIEQYQAGIAQLQVIDIYGRRWMLQEGSGQWFVFHDNQWTASDPHQMQVQDVSQPRNKIPKKTMLIAGIGIAVAVCLLVTAMAGVYWLYQDGKLTFLNNLQPSTTNSINTDGIIDLSFNQIQNYTFQAGQEMAIDSNGARLSIPADGLTEGGSAEVIVSDPGAQLQQMMNDVLETKSRFYQVIASGENDGTGWATVSVPAGGGDPYLMEIIDGKYIALTSLMGMEGDLSFQVPIGSATSDQGDESVSLVGESQFAVLQSPIAFNPAGLGHLASVINQGDSRSCGINSIVKTSGYMAKPEYETMSFCRKNSTGTIQVLAFPPETPEINAEMVDPVVDIIEQIMTVYKNEGFTAAKLENRWLKRLKVVIKKGSGDPYYSAANGVVYIPEDSVKKGINSDLGLELAHELAHWVQDEAYNLTSSYWASWSGISSESKWWLEVSAENMVFLFDQTAVERNLTMYGMTNPSDSRTPFQFSPNQWNDQLYIHAQLVKVFMCENTTVCPISQSGFVTAINTGTFPYSAAAINKVSTNLSEYARYLLGKSPQNANPVIPIMPAVKGGSGYGEFVNAKAGGNGEAAYQKTGFQPQMQEVNGESGKTIKISADIEKGAVYPLIIKNPVNEKSTGLPVEIKVSAGTPFYYRLGNGDIQFSDGLKEIVLGPVHSSMGLDKVRIVAIAADSVKTFEAVVQPINLSGDWLLISKRLVSDSVQCDENENVTINLGDTAAASAAFTSFPAAVAGVYSIDSGGTGYTWLPQPGADMTFSSELTIELAGSALLTKDGIHLQNKITIPKPQANNAVTSPLASGLGLSAILGLLFLKKQRKLLISLIVIGNLILLSGCSGGFGGFTGTYSNDIIFTKIEAVGNKTAAEIYQEIGAGMQGGEENALQTPDMSGVVPRYILTGISNASMDITLLSWFSTIESTETFENHCSGTLQYEVVGVILDDGQITTMFTDE